MILLVFVFQITTFPDSSPEAKKRPLGEIEMDLTQVSWNLKSKETCVGKGLRSSGDGKSGIRALGSSTLIFFFMSLGHKYKSRHLSKCSLIKF